MKSSVVAPSDYNGPVRIVIQIQLKQVLSWCACQTCTLDGLGDRSMAPCSTNGTVDANTLKLLQDIANKLRIDSIKATNASSSG